MAWKSHRYYVIYNQGDDITPDTNLRDVNLVHQSIAYGIERMKRYILVDIPKGMKLYKKFDFQHFYKTRTRKKIKDVKYWVYEKVQSGLPEFKVIETNIKNK